MVTEPEPDETMKLEEWSLKLEEFVINANYVTIGLKNTS
jgi:hypothetical protein